eukprot:5392298-Lingulodinium_polyedra.AAC.1
MQVQGVQLLRMPEKRPWNCHGPHAGRPPPTGAFEKVANALAHERLSRLADRRLGAHRHG